MSAKTNAIKSWKHGPIWFGYKYFWLRVRNSVRYVGTAIVWSRSKNLAEDQALYVVANGLQVPLLPKIRS